MVQVNEQDLESDKAYHARGVIAKINQIGEVQDGLLTKPIYAYITLDTGKGKPAQCVRFVGKAPMVEDINGDLYLDMKALKEGDIVIAPALLYRKCEFSSKIYSEHLIQLQNYAPKDIIIADAPSDDDAIDLGALDLTTDSTTKNLVSKEIKNQTKQ